MDRSYGVLLALSSLPGEYGIGTMGREAAEFIDKLKAAGAKYWQMLPLTQQGVGDSPYRSPSAFAGSWYYLDFEKLNEAGLLTNPELETAREILGGTADASYAQLYEHKLKLLHPIFERRGDETCNKMRVFERMHTWVRPYCRYMSEKFNLEADFFLLLQTLFDEQWAALRKYANGNGISLIGDIPIYVAPDGVEAVYCPELFDKRGNVAGCPPDTFSADGQHWGNPIYDWQAMKSDGYGWWIRRFSHELERFDLVRVDHFRGFEAYWSIPAEATSAAQGHWEQGPGGEFFEMLGDWFGRLPVIAEDLGTLTPSFFEFMKKCGYPGIDVLHFAFASDASSIYLPHKLRRERVVYTGTHDNDTTLGWWRSLSDAERSFVAEYLGGNVDSQTISDRLIRTAMGTVCDLAIIPMQDILGLDGSARMNTPGTPEGNWRWRMEKGAFRLKHCASLRRVAEVYGRI